VSVRALAPHRCGHRRPSLIAGWKSRKGTRHNPGTEPSTDTGGEPEGNILERIRAWARDGHDHTTAAAACREHRDQLIVEALDLGYRPEQLADAAGISRTHVFRLVERSER